jgi:two-component system response regulator YesN
VVVEDQPELCNALARRISTLQKEYQVVGRAFNGQDGLTMIRSVGPDAAFVDIHMPFLDGLELLGRLSKEEKRRTKCIMLTAYSDFPYTQSAIRNGAFDYLLKPVSNNMLEEVLERVAAELGDDSGKAAVDVPSEEDLPLLREYAEQQIRRLIHEKSITDELVLQVLAIIETEFMHPITLKRLSDRLHVNESHLCRVFTNRVGMSLIRFLNGFRVHLAKSFMDETDLRIGDIARMVGFSNGTYFARVFRRKMNVTPSEYKGNRDAAASREH